MARVSRKDLEDLIAEADVGEAAAKRLREANEQGAVDKARGHGASNPSALALPEM